MNIFLSVVRMNRQSMSCQIQLTNSGVGWSWLVFGPALTCKSQGDCEAKFEALNPGKRAYSDVWIKTPSYGRRVRGVV